MISTIHIAYTWRIGSITLHLTDKDLFDLSVDAVVNSEQTDFVLSLNPGTISGQLHMRFGDALQDELDRQTEGQRLPAGTVLKTPVNKYYSYIFHAGFHQPDEWINEQDRESQETDSVRIIRRCVREILRALTSDDIQSIAFPLIGTGVYNIDPSLLAYEFAREVVEHAQHVGSQYQRDVWLSIRSHHAAQIIEPLVQGLVDGLYGTSSSVPNLGVGFLDRFNQRQLHAGDPRFRAWMLTRYTELLIEYIFFHLASVSEPPVDVETTLPPGLGMSFGFSRLEAQNLAIRLEQDGNVEGWPAYFVKQLRKDMHVGHRLQRIIQDRNNLAHGKAARSPEGIEDDLIRLIDPSNWAATREQFGDPGEINLSPWVNPYPAHGDANEGKAGTVFGILDRWTTKHYEYLVPDTGDIFRQPRQN
jgi:O-acetyl-ADP-ribose deacetylase